LVFFDLRGAAGFFAFFGLSDVGVAALARGDMRRL